MNIMVTGGAGYIGTKLVEKLTKHKSVNQIVVYDNLSNNNYNFFIEGGLQDGKIIFVKGDVLDSRTLEKWIKKVDFVFHLAAFVSTPFSRETPHQFEQVNHWGSAELSYLLEKYEVPVLYLSSASVYGLQNKKMSKLEEEHPSTHYGVSKLRGEQMIKRLSNLTDVYIVRSGNVYGYSKSLRFDAVINKFMFNATYLNRIKIFGSGKQHRPFIHVNELTDFLSYLPFDNNIIPGLYDAVSKNMSVLDIYNSFANIFNQLEAIYISQDMELDGLSVRIDPEIPTKFFNSELTFEEELLNFKDQFAFVPTEFVSNSH